MTGYLYICAGMEKMLANSIASLLRVDPSARIHVIGWDMYGYECRDIKTQITIASPFETTLYVDCDTVFAKRPDVDALLAGHDFAAALDPYPSLLACQTVDWGKHVSEKEQQETLELCGKDWQFLNGGVVAFRKTPATDFLGRVWHQFWMKYRQCDQFALARALKLTGIEFTTLDSRHNSYVIGDNAELSQDAVIHHFIWGSPEHKVEAMKKRGLWFL